MSGASSRSRWEQRSCSIATVHARPLTGSSSPMPPPTGTRSWRAGSSSGTSAGPSGRVSAG
eukprot:13625100-Alexandrium_andersonii.AAC.1